MTDANENAKAILEHEREASEKSRKEAFERMTKGKPTPTQDENDRFAMGEHIHEHEDDGSGPDPHIVTRQVEAKRPGASGSYQTRSVRPATGPGHRPE